MERRERACKSRNFLRLFQERNDAPQTDLDPDAHLAGWLPHRDQHQEPQPEGGSDGVGTATGRTPGPWRRRASKGRGEQALRQHDPGRVQRTS